MYASPLLFLLFIEGLSQTLRKCRVGARVGLCSINHLLFADDLALFAGSRKELQRLLDIVYEYARSNIPKSNIVVFGAGKRQHREFIT